MYTEKYNTYYSNLTLEKITYFMENSIPIGVKVINFKNENNTILCMISDSIYGIIPLDEFEVNLKVIASSKNGLFYPQVKKCINSIVSVIITKQINDTTFLLSRKENLKQSYYELKQSNCLNCEILAITPKFAYLDCGNGVSGRIHISQATTKKCDSFEELDEFNIGQLIKCNIIGYDDKNYRFNLSLINKAIFNEYNQITVHNLNDIVDGSITSALESLTSSSDRSFFVKINSSGIYAILNANTKDNLQIGDKVRCFVYKITKKGKLRLSLVSKIN